MIKLNDLFYKNTDMQEKLKNDNFNIENEFKQKLKELENESIRLENHISSLKEQNFAKMARHPSWCESLMASIV